MKMQSYTEYYLKRLNDQKIRLQEIDNNIYNICNIKTCKKRKYQQAMGYPNDYVVVQNPKSIKTNVGSNGKDAYIENLSNKNK